MGLFDGFGKRAAETRKNSKSGKKLREEELKRIEKEWNKIVSKYVTEKEEES